MHAGHYSILAISLGIFVSLLSWSLVAFRLTLRQRFDLTDIFVLAVGTVYGAGGSFIIWATETGQNPGGIRIIGKEPAYWTIPLLALVSILACLAASMLASPRRHSQAWSTRHAQAYDERQWSTALLALGWALLALGMGASTLYTRAYGGFIGFFEVAAALRAGLFEEAGDNPLSFLKPFGGFSIFASYLFAAVWLASPQHRAWSAAGLLASFALSSVTLLGWGGRVDLLVYWMTLLLGGLIYRLGVLPRLLSGAALLMVAMIVILPPITDMMNPGKSQAGYVEFFATELTFPLESSLHAMDLTEHRYGIDVITAPLFILPERIWADFDIELVSDLNSEALLGDALREGFGYTIPADLMTFGLYQFGIPGPMIIAVLWCLFLVQLDGWLVERFPRSISSFLYAHAVFSVAALSVLYFDPKMQITRNFHFILGTIAVLGVPLAASISGLRARANRQQSMGPRPSYRRPRTVR